MSATTTSTVPKDSNLHRSLFEATKSGKIESIRHALSLGQSVKQRDTEGNMAIHIAAKFGHLEAVKLLAQLDPSSLRQKNSKGKTPLKVASEAGRTGVADFLSSRMQPSKLKTSSSSSSHQEPNLLIGQSNSSSTSSSSSITPISNDLLNATFLIPMKELLQHKSTSSLALSPTDVQVVDVGSHLSNTSSSSSNSNHVSSKSTALHGGSVSVSSMGRMTLHLADHSRVAQLEDLITPLPVVPTSQYRKSVNPDGSRHFEVISVRENPVIKKLESIAEQAIKTHGRDSIEAVTADADLGAAYCDLKQWQAADAILLSAKYSFDSICSNTPSQARAANLHNLGICYLNMESSMGGGAEKAISFTKQSIEMWLALSEGKVSASAANSYVVLGDAYQMNGQIGEAISSYSTALKEYTKPNADRADALHKIASALGAIGGYSHSIKHAKEAMGLFKSLGDAVRAAEVAGVLGMSHLGMRDTKGATSAFKLSLELFPDKTSLAAPTPEVVSTRIGLGNCYLQTKQYKEALDQFQRALRGFRHSNTSLRTLALARRGCGEALCSLGKSVEGIRYYQEAYLLLSKQRDSARELAHTLTLMATAYTDVKRHGEASQACAAVVQLRRSESYGNPMELALACFQYAQSLQSENKVSDALSIAKQGLEAARKGAFGAPHPTCALLSHLLATLYHNQGAQGDAKKWIELAYTEFAQTLGEKNERTQSTKLLLNSWK